jgi:hypothetical protein
MLQLAKHKVQALQVDYVVAFLCLDNEPGVEQFCIA